MSDTLVSADRLLIGGTDRTSSIELDEHLATHGPLFIPADDTHWSAAIRQAVARSGLTGRGGAAFASAAKWEALRRATRRPIVVVNALEGEPASAKDRVLLCRAPHLVLDGAEVVATALGAAEIVVCIGDHSAGVAGSVESALADRRRAGIAGRKVSVRLPPGRYVTGEESALIGWLGGRGALPVMRMDKSVPLRLAGRPVLVHNAETLSHVALIARHGPDWFRRLGTPDAPGSTLVTVTGAPSGSAVVEVELGTPVGDILDRAGVGPELSAVLLGGYGGTWLDASRLDTPYAPGPLAMVGAWLGVGVIIGLPAAGCGIAETARIARYLAGESAGQCGPCIFGLPAIAADLELLSSGLPRSDPLVLERITQRSAIVEGRGACRHPDGAVRLVRSALEVFAEDASSHARGRPCPGHAAPTMLPFPPAPARPGSGS